MTKERTVDASVRTTWSPRAFFVVGAVSAFAFYNFDLWAPVRFVRLALELSGAAILALFAYQAMNWRRAILAPDTQLSVLRGTLGTSIGLLRKPEAPVSRSKALLGALKTFGKARRKAAPFRPDAVRYGYSARLQESLDGMIELVVKDFVSSWYTAMISKENSFLVEVERGIQHAVASSFRHVEGSRLQFQDFAVSRVLPLVLQHVIHFKKAERRFRGANLGGMGGSGQLAAAPSPRVGLLQHEESGFSSDSDWDEDAGVRRRGPSKSPVRPSLASRNGDNSTPGNSGDSLHLSTDSLPKSVTLPENGMWTLQDAELARHFHQTFALHPAILPIPSSTSLIEEKYLRKLVDRLLPELAPLKVSRSKLASTLVREIVVCKVLQPLLEFLSDPDFWNETIIKLVDFLTGDKLLSNLSEAIRTTSAAAGAGRSAEPPPSSTVDRNIRTYEDLLEAIRNCDDVVEAKLLLRGVLSEMESKRGVLSTLSASPDKASRAKADKMQVYLNKLEIAKTRLDRRMLRLEGADPDVPPATMSASFSDPAPALDVFLKDPHPATFFATFMDRLGRPEILQGWRDIEELVTAYRSHEESSPESDSRLVDTIRDLYDVYFAEDAPARLPLNEGVLRELERVLAKLPSENALPRASSTASLPARGVTQTDADMDPLSSAVIEQDRMKRTSNLDINVAPFMHAQLELREVLERGYYAEFLRSTAYIEFLSERNRTVSRASSTTSQLSPMPTPDHPDDAAASLAEAEKRLAEATRLESDLTDRVINFEDELQELVTRTSGLRKTDPHFATARSRSGRTREQLRHEIDSARTMQAAAEGNVKRLREERMALQQQQQGILYVAGYVATYVRVAGSMAVSLTYEVQVERFDVNGKKLSDWVVSKSYAQFVTLHRLVKGRFPTLVTSSMFPVRTVVGDLVGKESSETRRKALDAYLRNLLKSNAICQWGPMVQFLTPERVLRSLPSARGRDTQSTPTVAIEDDFVVIGNAPSPSPSASSKHPTASPSSPHRAPMPNPTKAADADGFEFEIVDADDISNPGTSAIVHQFVVELFDLQNKNNYWRRQAWNVLMKQFGGGGLVQKRVSEILEGIVSENSLLGYITFFRTTFWPHGTFVFDRVQRTEEQKRASESEAARRLNTLIPDLLGSLVGRENAKAGAQRIFALFQNRRLNQELAFRLLDLSLNSVGFDEAVSHAWHND